MVSGDWLKETIEKKGMTEDVDRIWKMAVWGVLHMEKIPLIMGQISCEGQERKKIKQFLYQEKKYELLVAMTYAEKGREQRKEGKRSGEKEIPFWEKKVEQEESSALLRYQLFSFLQWCDPNDYRGIFERQSNLEWQRFCYLALAVGYQKLALFFACLIEEQKEKPFVLEKYGNRIKLLEKKWMVDFYRKQPEGKRKKKLAKRMVKYGSRLFLR